MFQNADLIHLLDGIPHAVILVDKDLRVSRMNRRAEALTGRSNGEVKGVKVNYVMRSDLHPFREHLRAALDDKQIVTHEGTILDRNRKIIPTRFSVSPVENHDTDVLGAMMVLEDLSLAPYLQEQKTAADSFEGIVSLSPRMQEVGDQIPVFAGTDASVLIDGEIGTGKGFVAEMIHNASKRSGYPFIKVNSGALPEPLLESELFGHARGAFPGAEHNKPGMFRLADHGTIFFTEIGDLPLPLQLKLLTVMDEGEFFALGSTKKMAMNVRIIAATSMDLKAMIHEGRFREDLFYRINVLRLHLPPLRGRVEDIPLLIDHFLQLFSSGNTVPQFDAAALNLLKGYSFPGNVRELRNIVEHAVTLSHGKTIKAEHLPEYIALGEGGDRYSSIWEAQGEGHRKAEGEGKGGTRWDDVEKDMIIDALRKSRGKRSDAAKMLGWARSTLYRKLKYHDI